jgi:hypothetical protein
MANTLGFRNQKFTEEEADFNRMRLPEEIPTISAYLSGKKNEKAVELLGFLWMRCMHRDTGDCKFRNLDMAKILNVTERSVFRYLMKLKKHGFVSILTRRRFDKETQTFNSTRFIRVWAAVYHSHYNIKQSNKLLWECDFRPNAYYALQTVPLKYKISAHTVIPTKRGKAVMAPRREFKRISTNSLFFQMECAQPGKDIVPVEAWDKFVLLQNAMQDPEGYPDQALARMVLGRSFKDFRTRWVIGQRYKAREKLAQEATGYRYVKDPISAQELWPKFQERSVISRRSA